MDQTAEVPKQQVCFQSDQFFAFYTRLTTGKHKRPLPNLLPYHIIGLDPGETTGVSIWSRAESQFLVTPHQINTSTMEWGVDRFSELIQPSPGSLIIMEGYRVYAWKLKEHSFSSLFVPRLIGCVETLCRLRRVPLVIQSAQKGKSFVTDDRLKEWGLYIPGSPHANDATRHVCQVLLFEEFK